MDDVTTTDTAGAETTDTGATAGTAATETADSRKVPNADGSVTVTLDYPIQSMGETVSKITLPRPKGAQLRAMDTVKGNVSQMLALIAKLAGLEPSAADRIDMADFTVLSEVIEGFSKGSRATGAAS